jgi:hypothetical protein
LKSDDAGPIRIIVLNSASRSIMLDAGRIFFVMGAFSNGARSSNSMIVSKRIALRAERSEP